MRVHNQLGIQKLRSDKGRLRESNRQLWYSKLTPFDILLASWLDRPTRYRVGPGYLTYLEKCCVQTCLITTNHKHMFPGWLDEMPRCGRRGSKRGPLGYEVDAQLATLRWRSCIQFVPLLLPLWAQTCLTYFTPPLGRYCPSVTSDKLFAEVGLTDLIVNASSLSGLIECGCAHPWFFEHSVTLDCVTPIILDLKRLTTEKYPFGNSAR